MDHTEDLSARVLLKHILGTEQPRTPITRSASQAEPTSAPRRSNRLTSNKIPGAQTPRDIIRRSLKHKLRESITKSLPAAKRPSSVAQRKANTPAPSSLLFDDDDTPRHVLRNILRAEPVRTPVVHNKSESEQPRQSSANSSIASKRPSIELSTFDLPDITVGSAANTVKGLSRKRPRRNLNITAFEKRLKDGGDFEVEKEASIGDHSSLSLSSTSLNLKTPFVEAQTEKRGLQRRVSNRRKVTEEEFGAAVNKRQMGGFNLVPGVKSFVEPGPSDTAYSEGFTLGFSKLSEPDITNDIIHCNTALYAKSDAMTSNLSIVATQDKPTVMASQLQRMIAGVEQEELMEAEQNEMAKDKSMYLFPIEEATVAELQSVEAHSLSQSGDGVGTAEHQEDEENPTADQPEDAAAVFTSEEEEGTTESGIKVNAVKSGEENTMEAESENEVVADTESEGEEGALDSQTEEDEEEEGEAASQPEEDVVDGSESEAAEEVVQDSQTEEEAAADSHSVEEEGVSQYQSDGENAAEADSQAEDEHEDDPEEEDVEQTSEEPEPDSERISRRAHRSEGGVVAVTEAGDVTEAGGSDGKSEAHSSTDLHSGQEMGNDESDLSHAEAGKENNHRLSVEDGGHPIDESPGEAAEQEEEWEDEEDVEGSEEGPSKTPAFVREKRLFHHDPLASPVLKNIQVSDAAEGVPAPKPKPTRRRPKPAKREGALPKSYLMNMFKHFAKTKVSADVYPVLQETMDKFFQRMAEDLEAYTIHAKRKTIEVEDAELLLRRQGHVNDKVPVEVLIEKYLRMDQRKLLIPIATSGNVVIPKKRK